ncbi:MAG: hypothetical protein OER82_01600 [Nitrosopumilus sp.]|nr:hypothetical protein [Nitrosopumilus sp.]
MSKLMFGIGKANLEALKGHSIRSLIESNVYVKNDEHKYIRIPNSRLDFSAEFVYLGFTKAGNPKFGEIIYSGPEGVKTRKRIGKFDGKYLSVSGDSFLKSVDEMREAAYQ